MSTKIPKKLQKLDRFLCSDAVGEDTMLLSELDGFLAGIVVCPDMIMPSEWLPCVWGEMDGPEFDSEEQAQEILGLIMWYYNDIIAQLDRSKYRPVYDLDTDDSIFWETWMEGFWQAMRLRPHARDIFAQSDDKDIQRAFFVLGRLAELAVLQPDEFEGMDIDEQLKDTAPDMIPPHVEILHRARLTQASKNAPLPFAPGQKTGRNDPCPCGSGKKFKKCCLH